MKNRNQIRKWELNEEESKQVIYGDLCSDGIWFSGKVEATNCVGFSWHVSSIFGCAGIHPQLVE